MSRTSWKDVEVFVAQERANFVDYIDLGWPEELRDLALNTHKWGLRKRFHEIDDESPFPTRQPEIVDNNLVVWSFSLLTLSFQRRWRESDPWETADPMHFQPRR